MIDALGDDHVPVAHQRADLPVGLRPIGDEAADEALDVLPALDRLGRDVVVDPVLGEVSRELFGVEALPGLEELENNPLVAGFLARGGGSGGGRGGGISHLRRGARSSRGRGRLASAGHHGRSGAPVTGCLEA